MTGQVFVDELGTVRTWLNSRAALVGPGNPVRDGFHLSQRDSPGNGIYGVLTLVDAGDDTSGALGEATISCSLWAANIEAATRAANGYANTLQGLVMAPYLHTDGSKLLWAANVHKSYSPDRGHPRFIVSADFSIGPG